MIIHRSSRTTANNKFTETEIKNRNIYTQLMKWQTESKKKIFT